MKPFEYYKVSTVAQAISLLVKYQEKAAILAGGSDLFGMMKDGPEGPKFKMPQHLIDIKGIKDLNTIKEQKGSLKIGATTTLSEISSSRLIAEKFPLLVQAAGQVGVPQIRNVGTLAGNLCQRPRCWYFRGKLFRDCLRKGGNDCYAQSGENQYHAILGAEGCCMVFPSDMAPALMALNAKVEIATPKGNRTVPIEKFYIGPEKNVLRENILSPQEMVVGIEVPIPPAGSKGVFLKLKERAAFDFAIVSVAVQLAFKGNAVTDSRVVFGGIAPYPFRALKAEAALKGEGVKERMATACKAAVERARPLSQNEYKVAATKGSLEKALGLLA
jgi:xanthine dehydrogenase YagS FAD-binding subunit